MSAPIVWILIPILLAGVLWFIRDQRTVTLTAIGVLVLLTMTAWLLPIDVVLKIAGLSFKITPALEILGRRLVIENQTTPLLAIIYGSLAVWFGATLGLPPPRRLIQLGLILTSLLVAALTVQPFLYAALFIEIAVLLALPLLSPPGRQPGKGVIRFLIFQTLAMPFILFSGWLLTGIEANPGNVGLVGQAAILLALGFAFLLAMFPFYTWIPLIAEEAHPFTVGLLLWLFPTASLFFGLEFLDNYTWLRDSPLLGTALSSAGLLMIVTGGLLSLFQRHLGRMLGYAVIVESGFSLLTISLGTPAGFDQFFMLFIPRLLSLVLWAFSLSIFSTEDPDLTLEHLKGAGRRQPYAAAGILLGGLGLAGLPLLAGFPVRLAIWESLAALGGAQLGWVFVGSLGLLLNNLRVLMVLFESHQSFAWQVRETRIQRILLAAGWLLLLLYGILPQWAAPMWVRLPAVFEHLGQ